MLTTLFFFVAVCALRGLQRALLVVELFATMLQLISRSHFVSL